MKQDMSNGRGTVECGPRIETTVDKSSGRLTAYDPGARTPNRQLTVDERHWLNSTPYVGNLATHEFAHARNPYAMAWPDTASTNVSE